MSDEASLQDVMASLRTKGYTSDFATGAGGTLRCGECNHIHSPSEAIIEHTARFEGASNPDDEAVVYGLNCPGCGIRGVLVAAYGPAASEDEAAVVIALTRVAR